MKISHKNTNGRKYSSLSGLGPQEDIKVTATAIRLFTTETQSLTLSIGQDTSGPYNQDAELLVTVSRSQAEALAKAIQSVFESMDKNPDIGSAIQHAFYH